MFNEGYTKKENSFSRWNDVNTNKRSNSPRRLGAGGGLGVGGSLVWDVGTGTGTLAIWAARAGATSVRSCERE